MEIFYDILGIALIGGVMISGILITWQEINLNKKLNDKKIEKIEEEINLNKELYNKQIKKIETEIVLITEQIIHKKLMRLKIYKNK